MVEIVTETYRRLVAAGLLIAFGLASCTPTLLHHASWSNKPPLTTQVNGNLWQDMQRHFTLTGAVNQHAVQTQIHAYLTRKAYLNRIIRRASPYLFYIYQQTYYRIPLNTLYSSVVF